MVRYRYMSCLALLLHATLLLHAAKNLPVTACAHSSQCSSCNAQERRQPLCTQRRSVHPSVKAFCPLLLWLAAAVCGQCNTPFCSITSHLLQLLGSDGLLAIPSAPGPSFVHGQVDPAAFHELRMAALSLTCIAGLAGLPQVCEFCTSSCKGHHMLACRGRRVVYTPKCAYETSLLRHTRMQCPMGVA